MLRKNMHCHPLLLLTLLSFATSADEYGTRNTLLAEFIVAPRGKEAPEQPDNPPRKNGNNIVETEMEHSRKNILKQFNIGFDITPETTGLMGEQIDLSTGSLSFSQTDINIPGNFKIPVQVTRISGTADVEFSANRLFGDWSLDIPYVSTSMASLDGLSFTGSWAANRACSGTLNPLQTLSKSATTLEVQDYWSGDNVYIPGQGSARLLYKDSATPRTSNKNLRIQCFNSSKGYEGFKVTTTDGITYTFEQLRLVRGLDIGKAAPPTPQSTTSEQPEDGPPPINPPGQGHDPNLVYYQHYHTFMLVSKIEDRFGNNVVFQYSGNRLENIVASDGRRVDFTYETLNNTDYIKTASANGQTWHYQYQYNAPIQHLRTVIRPDNRSWEFSYSQYYNRFNAVTTTYGQCLNWDGANTHSMTIRHPHGAIARFDKRAVLHGRTEVPRHKLGPVNDRNYDFSFAIDRCFNSVAIVAKELRGPGLPTMQWQYQYSQNEGAFIGEPKIGISDVQLPAHGRISAGDLKRTTVTAPDGSVTKHYFSRRFNWEDGKELFSDQYDKNGTTLLRRTATEYAKGPAYGIVDVRTLPTTNSEIAQHSVLTTKQEQTDLYDGSFGSDDGVFSTSYSDFNQYDQPTLQLESNSLNSRKRYKKTDFYHDTALWVLNQTQREQYSSDNSSWITAKETSFYASNHSAKSLPYQQYRFGTLLGTLTYHTDGNVRQYTYNEPNRWVEYSNYKRGKPQQVRFPQRYPTGCTPAQGCSWVMSQQVNDSGTVAAVTDLNNNTTNYSYDGLNRLKLIDPADSRWANTIIDYQPDPSGGGAMLQTVQRGNYRKTITLDALMQPILSKEWDASRESETVRYVRQQFNPYGRAVFQSVPERSANPSYGSVSTFDGLQRLVSQTNTPQGDIRYRYLNANRIGVSNGRNFETITEYLAYGSPTTDQPLRISQPENVETNIQYNLFEQPILISQGGINEVRRYNSQQQLCLLQRPETGIKAMQYNSIGELRRFAEGLTGNAQSCSDYNNVANAWVEQTYDTHGDPWKTLYSDTSQPTLERLFDSQGNLRNLINGSNNWSYNYNSANLVEYEQLSIDNKSYLIDQEYDSLGNLAVLQYGGASVQFAPNALGQPTQASDGQVYANQALFHPNGIIASFRFGNGLQFSQSLNSEYKPDIRQIAANGVLRQGQRYRYDANDNIDNIQDLVNSSKNISLSYDGLDRISTANGYWGSGSFSYDTLGNLRQKNLGSQQLSYSYLNNRVSTVTGGYNFSYDERGNAVSNGRRSFNFNRANQLASSGSVSYNYDGHGRRIKKTTSTSQYSVYSQNGQLLLTDGPSGITRYVYLGKELVARIGNPAANDDKPGYTGHIEDRDIGLTYMQARYYDPVIGRFYSNDPVDFMGHMQRGNSTMGFNRYAYANNNPYKYTDPDGEFVNFIIGAAIGASIDAGLQVMAGMESGKSFSDSVKGVDLKSVAVSGALGAVGMQGAVGLTAAAKGSAEFGVGAMKTTLQLGSKTERAVVGADSAAKVSAVAVVTGERNGSTATTVPAKLIDAAAGKPVGTIAEKAINKAMEEPKEEQK